MSYYPFKETIISFVVVSYVLFSLFYYLYESFVRVSTFYLSFYFIYEKHTLSFRNRFFGVLPRSNRIKRIKSMKTEFVKKFFTFIKKNIERSLYILHCVIWLAKKYEFKLVTLLRLTCSSTHKLMKNTYFLV